MAQSGIVTILWHRNYCSCPIRTSSNGNIFRGTGPLWGQRQVTRSFHVYFDLRLNKRLSKQSIRRWVETPSRWLWHRCNAHWIKKQSGDSAELCRNLYCFDETAFWLICPINVNPVVRNRPSFNILLLILILVSTNAITQLMSSDSFRNQYIFTSGSIVGESCGWWSATWCTHRGW